MTFLPILYIWLGVIVTGVLATFIAGYFVDNEKSNVAGFSIALGMAMGSSPAATQMTIEWWVHSLGIVAGLVSLWWYLFKREARQHG